MSKTNGRSSATSPVAIEAGKLDAVMAERDGLRLHLERVLDYVGRAGGFMSHADQVVVRSAKAFLEAVQ